jgi:hypothetical protein
MTDNTEPTIDELISNLACATHFLPEEDCIYCDTEKIKALISDQVAKARIDEIMRMREAMTFTHMTPSIYAAERVKTLLGDE